MEQVGLGSIRNVVLLSHSGAGKTSLSEAILFNAGVIKRLGSVADGTTTSDYEPEEIRRKISLNLALLPYQWRDAKINLIDTPGYPDFIGEVKTGMRVSEGAVIVICAASGVEVGTELVWSYCEEAKLPRLMFVNKMDRDNADFYRTVKDIQAKFGSKCVPLQLPIGAQATFTGVVDLLAMKSYMGTEGKEAELPAAMRKEIDSFREKLVEAIAEVNDGLIEKYLNGEELSLAELGSALRQAVKSGVVTPILVGSGLKNIGLRALTDAMYDYLPSPAEVEVAVLGDSEKRLKPSQEGPPAALVFKTSADPYVGKLAYFRVYNGIMSSNFQAWNATRGETERIGQLYMLRGKTQEPVPQVVAGDVGAVAKLGVTATGDTLSTQSSPIRIVPISFPQPIFEEAVYPKTKADVDKMGTALSRLPEEDPTLQMHRQLDTAETILAGMGETHLEVAVERMARKFGVNVELKTPKVPYKETITVPVTAEYKHKKQTGGHGQYGHAVLELEPLPRGTGNEFAEKVVGGAVPRNYYPAVEKGVNDAWQEGVLAGYPVADMRTTLIDGSYHPVDSSEICFKIAGAQAVKKGLAQARPILLEPIVNLKVTIPEQFTGDIISDLNSKRARVMGMAPEDGKNIIEAQAPLAELLRYAIDLRSITQGRGSYTIQFSHYEEVPQNVAQRIIAAKQAEKAAV